MVPSPMRRISAMPSEIGEPLALPRVWGFGWENSRMSDTGRQVAAAVMSRAAALKEQLAELQEALADRGSEVPRLASDARDWVSDHARSLSLRDFIPTRAALPAAVTPGAVIAAALVVGVGVGCVLYAVTSGRRRPPVRVARRGVRRHSTRA